MSAVQTKLKELARIAFVDWTQGQSAKIRANRPEPVADHCVLLAMELAGKRSPLVLKQPEIEKCEARAVSQARVTKFGALPRTEDEWRSQCAQIREDWRTAAPDDSNARASPRATPNNHTPAMETQTA